MAMKEMEITLISLGFILFIISFVEICNHKYDGDIKKGGNHVQYLYD